MTRWASKASFSASGIDAADVLPCLSQCHHDLLGRDAKLLGDAVENALVGLMRNKEIDLVGRIAVPTSVSSMTPEIFCTAWRKTSRPFMRRCPTVFVEPGPPST